MVITYFVVKLKNILFLAKSNCSGEKDLTLNGLLKTNDVIWFFNKLQSQQ